MVLQKRSLRALLRYRTWEQLCKSLRMARMVLRGEFWVTSCAFPSPSSLTASLHWKTKFCKFIIGWWWCQAAASSWLVWCSKNSLRLKKKPQQYNNKKEKKKPPNNSRKKTVQQLYISNPCRKQSVEKYSELHPNTGWWFRRADWFASCSHARKWGVNWHQCYEMRVMTSEPSETLQATLWFPSSSALPFPLYHDHASWDSLIFLANSLLTDFSCLPQSLPFGWILEVFILLAIEVEIGAISFIYFNK